MFITQSYYALLVFFSLGKKNESMCYTLSSSIHFYPGENITSTKAVQSLLNSFLTAYLKTMVCGCFCSHVQGCGWGNLLPGTVSQQRFAMGTS